MAIDLGRVLAKTGPQFSPSISRTFVEAESPRATSPKRFKPEEHVTAAQRTHTWRAPAHACAQAFRVCVQPISVASHTRGNTEEKERPRRAGKKAPYRASLWRLERAPQQRGPPKST